MASSSNERNSPPPPPLSSATSPPSTFLITTHGTPITTSSITITSPPSPSPLYTCTLQTLSKPHILINSCSSNSQQVVGSITFHAFTRSITLTIFKNDGMDGREEMEMGHKNFLKSGYQYLSPTLGGEVEWKSYGEGFSVLLDAGGNAVARFDNKTWGGGKERVLEVVVDDDDDDGDGKGGRREEVMIEVLVGAIAIMESRRRNAKSSIITAGVLGV